MQHVSDFACDDEWSACPFCLLFLLLGSTDILRHDVVEGKEGQWILALTPSCYYHMVWLYMMLCVPLALLSAWRRDQGSAYALTSLGCLHQMLGNAASDNLSTCLKQHELGELLLTLMPLPLHVYTGSVTSMCSASCHVEYGSQ